MDDFCQLTKAISDPTRVRICKMLENGELCVCHITERLDLAQSTVSKHLALLRQAQLVTVRRQGLWAYYRLADSDAAARVRRVLDLLRGALNADASVCEDRQALERTCCAAVEEGA